MVTRSILTLFHRHAGRVLAVLMALAFLGASLPPAAVHAQTSNCQDTYTVQRGDYLVKIAAEYAGVSFLDIANANDIEAPYTIFVGQRLCIPRAGGSGSSGSGSGSSGGSADVSWDKDGDDLEVTAENLDDEEFYFVRVDDAEKSGYTWIKVGVLESDDDGEGDGRYDLPDELEDSDDFTVCLKNTVSDELVCSDPRLSTVDDDGSGTGGQPSGNEDISVRLRSNDRIEVTVEGLDRNTFYFVRVDDADKSAYEWFKVGTLKTDSDREGNGTYDLPEELEGVDEVNVCLKNTSNDELICTDSSLNRAGDEDDDDDDGDPDRATFTVTRLSGDRFRINTSRFPEDSFWNVRVREWGGSTTWYTVDVLRTGDDSSASYIYEIPERLSAEDDLYICLKNLVTNDLKCVVSNAP